MTKIISELLGATEPFFSISVEQLERACGRPNVDIRLSAEIIGKAHRKMHELGLDPQDTTEEELYHALRNLVRLHDHFIAHWLGGEDPNDVADMLPRVQRMVNRLDIPRSGWFLKHSVAKRLLKANPPKKVMKVLGYRSVDSMLKHEPTGALFAAMRFLETEQWFAVFMAKYDKLTPSDFEGREIEIIRVDHIRWSQAALQVVKAKHHNVMQVKELGTIVILPLPVERLAGISLTLMLLLLHAINDVRLHSAYTKLQQVKPGFGKRLTASLVQDKGYYAQVLGHDIHWRVVQRHLGRLPQHHHPETFEPHVQPDDLVWREAEEVLYRLEPALHFWYDMDYVALAGHDGQPISFNLMDMALNYVNQLPFERRLSGHARASLWNELYDRYLQQPAVKEQVLKQFDGSLFETEVFAKSLQGKEV